MNISLIRFIIAAVLIMIGILIMVIQTFGVFKLNYALNRMHAAAMGDSLGIMMIVLGMMVIYGISFASLKLLLFSGLHHRYAAIYWPSLKSARMNRLRMNARCRKNDWFENIIARAADHLYYRSELFKKSAGFCCYLYGI